MSTYEENFSLLRNLPFDSKYSEELALLLSDVNSNEFNKFVLEYTKYIALLHTSEKGSPFWRKRAIEKKISSKDIEFIENPLELAHLLGQADYSILQQPDGYLQYLPEGSLNKYKLFKSSSSGTTGLPKTVYHSEVPLAASAIAEYTAIINSFPDLKPTKRRLLAFGPEGAFQKEHSYLAKLLDLEYTDLSFDTTGMKLLPPEKVMERIGPRFVEASKYLKNYEVSLITGTKESVFSLPKEISSVDLIKISGTEVDQKTIEEISKKIGVRVMPMYGHFAGKSSPGFVVGNSIVYYPPSPFTQFFVVDEKLEPVKYEEEGNVLMFIVQPELLLVKLDDKGKRGAPNRFFSFDGVKDPHR